MAIHAGPKKVLVGTNHHCAVAAQYFNRVCRRDRSGAIYLYALLVSDRLEGADVCVI